MVYCMTRGKVGYESETDGRTRIDIFVREPGQWKKLGALSKDQPIQQLIEMITSKGCATIRIADKEIESGTMVNILFWGGRAV